MTPPTVSVLIPAYNRATYVGEAIQSILDQSFCDLEVVVVDDGSTDNTAEVVASFTDPRVRLIRQENRGISGAFNTAYRGSRGRYIAMLGSDDRWLPGLLAEEIPILETNPDMGLVYARARAMDAAGRPLAAISGAPERFPGQTFKSLLYGDFVSGITAIFRREHVETVGPWDESLVGNEDWDMWLRLSLVCRFHFIDKVLAEFRVHPGRTTGGASSRFVTLTLDRVRVLNKLFARSDLPLEAAAIKRVAYRNVYIDVGLRWLSVRNWRETLRYFGKATRVYPDRGITLLRIIYLILVYNLLSKWTWGTRLVHGLAAWRRQLAR